MPPTMRRVGSFSSSEEQSVGQMVIALAAMEARRLAGGHKAEEDLDNSTRGAGRPQPKHGKPQQSEGIHTVPKWGKR